MRFRFFFPFTLDPKSWKLYSSLHLRKLCAPFRSKQSVPVMWWGLGDRHSEISSPGLDLSLSLSHFIRLFRKPTYFHPGAIYWTHLVKQLTPQLFSFFFFFKQWSLLIWLLWKQNEIIAANLHRKIYATWSVLNRPPEYPSTSKPAPPPSSWAVWTPMCRGSSQLCLPWSLPYFAHLGIKLPSCSWSPATYVLKLLWSCFSCCL